MIFVLLGPPTTYRVYTGVKASFLLLLLFTKKEKKKKEKKKKEKKKKWNEK